mmetsp:Transcript_22449/g.53200  ORF Transcript_22449/g.53200 Transcript_22449/m.53200 type:complete len:795 (+) Transcript_22449:739-3123(+)
MVSYSGEVVSGCPLGEGECTYADGSRYTGSFWYGLKSGTGTLTPAHGLGRLTGLWYEDKPWSAMAEGDDAFALWHAGTRSGLFARGGNDTGIAPTAGDGEATASSLHVFASREEAEKAFVEAAANVSFSHAGALFAGRRQGPGRSTYRDGCYLDGSWEADRLSAHGVGRVPLQLGHYEGELGFAPNTTSQSLSASAAHVFADGWGAYTQPPSAVHAELDARACLTPLANLRLSTVRELGYSFSSDSALNLAETWRNAKAHVDGAPGERAEGESPSQSAPSLTIQPQRPRPQEELPGTPPRPGTRTASQPQSAPAVKGAELNLAAVPAGGSRLLGEWSAGRPCTLSHGGGGGWWRHALADGSLVWWYSGSWLGGLRHGQGTCVYYTQDLRDEGGASKNLPEPLAVFSGGWQHGRWDGEGLLCVSRPARTLTGEFRGGIRSSAVRVQIEPGGSLYTGELSDGLRSGTGMSVEHSAILTMSLSAGAAAGGPVRSSEGSGSGQTVVKAMPIEYVGKWRLDVPHGLGKQTDAAGEYEGEFDEGLPHGRGVLRKRSGAVFRGTWEYGVMEGRGRALPAATDGPRHWTEGVWVAGNLNFESVDYGTAPLEGGGVYEGGLRESVPFGKGRAHWPNGDTMEGFWAYGEPDPAQTGICVRTSENGDCYVGEYRGGSTAFPRPHGFGALTLFDGERCEGSWSEGMPLECNGVVMIEGQRYSGAWRGGVRTGLGKLCWPSGEEYEGIFADGLPHGRGEQRYADGSVYHGIWRRGVPHGRGKLTELSGRVMDAEWVDGRQLSVTIES